MLFEQDDRLDGIEAIHAATALYTSLHIVDQMLDQIDWPASGQRLLDPSAGDGSFILQALKRLAPEPGDFVAVSRVHGWEFHPGAVREARGRIRDYLAGLDWTEHSARRAAELIVIEADFLTDQCTGRFDRIVGNPPYLRSTHLPPYYRSLYARILPRYAAGDLMHAFLDRCADIATSDGLISLVTADRWIKNDQTAQLREQIGKRWNLRYLARLDSSTSFHRSKNRRLNAPPRVHPIQVLLGPNSAAGIELGREPIEPDELLNPSAGVRLGDLAEIKTGPDLGPHGIFTLDNTRSSDFPKDHQIPVADFSDIGKDNTLKQPTRFALRTIQHQAPPAPVARHIEATIDLMPSSRRRKTWWLPPESTAQDLTRPGILVPRINKDLRFALLPAGILPINHDLWIRAKPGGIPLNEIAQILCRSTTIEWIKTNAQRLENDYRFLAKRLLDRIPV